MEQSMSSLTRRGFMVGSATAGAALAARRAANSKDHGNWDFLNNDQAITLAALCDAIIPADDFPSASQAGVVTYIDRQLMRHHRPHRPAYEAGLAEADQLSRKSCGAPVASASAQIQQEVVAMLEREQPNFFNLLRRHTMEGYYGAPRHGGNRDAISWRMLGLAEPPLRGRAQYDLTGGAS
jgi:gluconate 2-dehydrogenase gamma chain